ncbi:unnamed protein product [Knipowitschia caucasica]
MENSSSFLFELSGLDVSVSQRHVYVGLALWSYGVTLLFNVLLVVAVAVQKALHQPMYVFIANVCVNGMFGASSFYPKLVHDLLRGLGTVTYSGCIVQMCAIYTYVFCEFTSLTVMALDRYLAICRPLSYHSVMTRRTLVQLLALTWALALLETMTGAVLTTRLPLCGTRLSKFFCTNWEVVKLSCSDTTANNIFSYVLLLWQVLQTALIVGSYVGLVRAALRSQADRSRVLQTCVPHLLVLLLFLVSNTFDFMFSRYGVGVVGTALSNVLAAEFLVVPPLLNPVIYGIKMQQIRSPITALLHRLFRRTEAAR